MEKFICLPCYCLYVYYSREEVKYSVVLCEVGGQIFIPYVSSVCLLDVQEVLSISIQR